VEWSCPGLPWDSNSEDFPIIAITAGYYETLLFRFPVLGKFVIAFKFSNVFLASKT